MALKEKKRQHRGTRAFRRRVLGKRWRTGFVVLGVLVVVLALVGVVGSYYLGAGSIGTALRASFLEGDEEASVGRVVSPVVTGEAPEPVSEETATGERAAEEKPDEPGRDKEAATQEEQAAAEAARLEAERTAAQEEQDELAALEEQETAADEEKEIIPPSDPTMYLNVPKLGISGASVAGGEAALETGTQLVSGAPWVPGSNTYIAGHRVGFPGTPSDHIFYALPSMVEGDTITLRDSLGQEYAYQVSEVFAVTPYDVGVTAPTGSDVVTLQVCTETPDDWWTIGPRLMSSGPESGRLIVRAVRV